MEGTVETLSQPASDFSLNLSFVEPILNIRETIAEIKGNNQLIHEYPWGNIPAEIIREIIIQDELYKDKTYKDVLKYILTLNILHFEDFESMSEDWINVDYFLTELVIIKVQEVGRHVCNPIYGRHLADKIANSGTPSWISIKTENYPGV